MEWCFKRALGNRRKNKAPCAEGVYDPSSRSGSRSLSLPALVEKRVPESEQINEGFFVTRATKLIPGVTPQKLINYANEALVHFFLNVAVR